VRREQVLDLPSHAGDDAQSCRQEPRRLTTREIEE
jgi:hypothetical protein